MSAPPSIRPSAGLLVGSGQLVERHVAGGRVVHVRRDRGGPVRRADRARDEPRPVRLGRLARVGGLAGEPGRGRVHLADDALEAVVGLGDPRCGEGVRLDDVGAGVEVGVMDRPDDLGLGER